LFCDSELCCIFEYHFRK